MSELEQEKPKHKYRKSTIIRPGEDKPKAAKERHYVDNKKFYESMKERRPLFLAWKEAGSIGLKPKVSEYIGLCIMQIAENLSKKYQFANYRFRDEMVNDAIEHCLKYIDSFDPEKSNNPFSYYTQTCYYQFLNRIKIEKTQQYIKYKATMSSAALGEVAEMAQNAGEEAEHAFDNMMFDTDFMEKFISDFEGKLTVQKEPRQKKRSGLEMLLDSANLEEGI